jgi:hypothetical protein
MVSVAQARQRAQKKVETERRAWAVGEVARLEIVVHPPTERVALDDLAAAIAWVSSWRSVQDGEVTWGERHWARAGHQSVPERMLLRSPEEIARFAGANSLHRWRLLHQRAESLRAAFSAVVDPVIRSASRAIEELSAGDFATMIAVVGWLAEHPASGARVREIPIRGIDSKWVERHRSLVEALFRAVTGADSLGLVPKPVLVRLRVLDPALRPGGLTDMTVPIRELASWRVDPDHVLVVENLETLLSLPDLVGVIAIHGGGFAAPRLVAVPWARRVTYWGDIDSHGFAILHALRSSGVDATSLLMDESTLAACRDLCVTEPRSATGVYATLTPAEARMHESLRERGNLRLEQERIPWTLALDEIRQRFARPGF